MFLSLSLLCFVFFFFSKHGGYLARLLELLCDIAAINTKKKILGSSFEKFFWRATQNSRLMPRKLFIELESRDASSADIQKRRRGRSHKSELARIYATSENKRELFTKLFKIRTRVYMCATFTCVDGLRENKSSAVLFAELYFLYYTYVSFWLVIRLLWGDYTWYHIPSYIRQWKIRQYKKKKDNIFFLYRKFIAL